VKIIALPDLHEALSHLALIAEELAAVDLALLVGDLTNSGTKETAARVINAVRQYNAQVLAVPGNWDTSEVSDYLSIEKINLHRRHVLMRGFAFIGVGGSLPYFSNTPTEYREEEYRSFLDEAAQELDANIPKILVSHEPPFQTSADKTWTGIHTGSKTIRAFIEREQPLICFTGHIHEGQGISHIGKTAVINPGPLWQENHPYAYAEIQRQEIITLEIRR
jgi:uncharacterized protein